MVNDTEGVCTCTVEVNEKIAFHIHSMIVKCDNVHSVNNCMQGFIKTKFVQCFYGTV